MLSHGCATLARLQLGRWVDLPQALILKAHNSLSK
jgi:hypothetical protein